MNTETGEESKVLFIPIEEIIPNRAQPRLIFDDQSLKELANSIKEHGIIQPLVLRKKSEKYEIIAGERRYRAAKLAGLTEVPAIITEMSDKQSAEVAIVENIQRKDLSAIEEAKSYKSLLDNNDMSQEELAKKMGVSQSAISNKIRLLSLADEVQNAILEGKISERHARSLLKVEKHEDQITLLNRIINERLTVKQLEQEIKKLQGSIPAVNNDINVDKIKSEAEDIIPLKIIDPDEKKSDVVDNKPNKFFNFLEETAVNMQTPESTSTPSDNNFKIEEPVITDNSFKTNESTNDEEIEMLDFSIPSPIDDKIINNIKNALGDLKYQINTSVENNKKTITITLED